MWHYCARYTQDRLRFYIRWLHSAQFMSPKTRREVTAAAKMMMQELFKPIPNSRLLLARCELCNQRMRVTTEIAVKSVISDAHRILCNKCGPTPLLDRSVFLTERQRAVLGKTRS